MNSRDYSKVFRTKELPALGVLEALSRLE